VGAFFRKPLSNNFSIQPEVYYSQKGYITPSDSLSSEARYSLNYLEVPVLFVYTIPKTNFNLFVGPYISIFLNGSITLNVWGIDISLDLPAGSMNTFDIGAVFGGMYSIKKFFLDTRASFGLTNFPSDGTNLKNYVFQISGGLRF
ncbi:MAG: porin family protein, partial [Candidatus Celaenobacter polaris]|nr:porin family protein [Candidatus Celaenobacter polaris]